MTPSNTFSLATLALALAAVAALGTPGLVQAESASDGDVSYRIVDTGQVRCYSDSSEITYPGAGKPFFGQDAQYVGYEARYEDNGDGTVTDLLTGLMWQQVPTSKTFGWKDAVAHCESLELAGHGDWRAPTVKELWSLQDFSRGWPYLNTTVFQLAGRGIGKNQQYWTRNDYRAGTTHGGAHTAFGVNHATGHIKGYPSGRGPQGKFVRAVRGKRYGINEFVDNSDGTITDRATGLTWMQVDSGHLKAGAKGRGGMDWPQALGWAENLEYAGHDDWRLPNVKELQSIVDYSGVFPAVDPVFRSTPITNEGGNADYGYYWTSTSAYFGRNKPAYVYAWYVAFGRAVNDAGQDTHGAGAVRFDTKVVDGPAGESRERVLNLVRCVRGGKATPKTEGPAIQDAQTMPADEGGFVARLDGDGDGKVSREEFDGPPEHFTQFDRDGDGYISEDEAPTGPPPGQDPPGGGPPPRGSGR